MADDALVRALALELVGQLLRGAEDADRSFAVLADAAGARSFEPLDEPGPDEHRLVALSAQAADLAAREVPAALGVATSVRDPLDGSEVVVVWAASADGARLALKVRLLVLSDGLLAPGPIEPLDDVQRGVADDLAAVLSTT